MLAGLIAHSKRAMIWAALGAVVLFAMLWAACGGGGSSTTVMTPAGTPAGTYTLSLNGTYASGAGSLKNSTNLTLTVQ